MSQTRDSSRAEYLCDTAVLQDARICRISRDDAIITGVRLVAKAIGSVGARGAAAPRAHGDPSPRLIGRKYLEGWVLGRDGADLVVA